MLHEVLIVNVVLWLVGAGFGVGGISLLSFKGTIRALDWRYQGKPLRQSRHTFPGYFPKRNFYLRFSECVITGSITMSRQFLRWCDTEHILVFAVSLNI